MTIGRERVAIEGKAERPARRVDLDRLRIFACLSTFCYHAIQIFDLNPYYHVRSHTLSPALDAVGRLLHAVRMPLFFLIAGMVGYLALQRYTNREFMRQRALRLLVPFAFGIVLVTPWVKYFELLDGRHIEWRGVIHLGVAMPDPLTFLRRYFTQIRWFSWSHMWFPLYLFLLGLLLLPLMRAMPRMTSDPPPAAALGLPLAACIAIEIALRPLFPHHIPNLIADWASMATYTVMLLAGAALIRWPVLEQALQRGLPVTALAAAFGAALYLGAAEGPLKGIGRAMTLWGTLCAAIGLGPWIGRGRIPAERYMAEAVLPVYVLHHVPLLLIATQVKDLPWPIWQRYATIVLGAFAITLAFYHVVVRPVGALRIALGLSRLARKDD